MSLTSVISHSPVQVGVGFTTIFNQFVALFVHPFCSKNVRSIDLWKKVKKEATHLKYFPDFAQLQAEVDRALLHFAQTPSEITVLMARYCETLGAKAA